MTRTLIVDGNSLLKTGFHGIKNLYNGTEHIGGLFHFLNTIRKFIDKNLITKTIVFWDGKKNYTPRRKINKEYKTNRKKSFKSPEDSQSFHNQQIRVQEYLEELYVRQSDYELCEADDCIAYYTSICNEEEIVVMTADRDLLQLISPNISVHITTLNKIFKNGEKVPLNGVHIPSENVRLVKSICGDSSDNIKGIYMVGAKSLIKIKPEILDKKVELKSVIETIKSKEKPTKKEKNIIEGVTQKEPTLLLKEKPTTNVIETNYYIIGMGKEFLTEKAIKGIETICKEPLDPEGRHWKNALDLMMSDGLLNILPKTDDAWVDFVRPFLRLSRIEKDFYTKKKKK